MDLPDSKLRLKRRLAFRRVLPLLIVDVLAGTAALFFSLLLRFEGAPPDRYGDILLPCALMLVTVQIVFLYFFRLYHVQWRYASLGELFKVVQAAALAAATTTALLLLVRKVDNLYLLPRSVLILNWILSTIAFGAVRLVPRIRSQLPSGIGGRKPALIYGAGTAAEQIIRDMLRHPDYPYFPAGLFDDDPKKWDTTLHGVRILGDGNRITAEAERLEAETLLIAIPSANNTQMRRIMEKAGASGIQKVMTLPGLDRIVRGEVTINMIREISLEDLLGRRPVEIDTAAVEAYLKGKRVLVTGAAGSIGSELCRIVLKFGPERLFMLDHDETDLYHLQQELRPDHADRIEARIADVRDGDRIRALMEVFRPAVVFHAAAYKQVPIIEDHPREATQTNVFGTRNVAAAAVAVGAERFILISTDKAVNPTSVMGATKRIAEMVIREIRNEKDCRFTAVRFGNVLGSRGSVVPIFREQIQNGGPVTVTDPEMKRYFMTIPEACRLVLQAADLADNGQVMVLDMGEPVKIVDLARNMIRLSGFEPDRDIPIRFCGIRPGEKLFEEYLTAEEGVDATRHAKIFTARITHDLSGAQLENGLSRLEEACQTAARSAFPALLKELVPTYERPKTKG